MPALITRGVCVALGSGAAMAGVVAPDVLAEARLAALYGPAASVVLSDHAPAGTEVTIVLPLATAGAGPQ